MNHKKPKRAIKVAGDIAYIRLTKGYVAIVDVADLPIVGGYNWSAQEDRNKDGSIRTVYAVRQANGSKVRLHREITGATSDMEVDHIDGNGLNNVRANIRVCSHAENLRNQSIRINNASGFKGIWKHQKGKWQAKIVKNGKPFHLGTFNSPEEAQAAYANASLLIHGEYGVPN